MRGGGQKEHVLKISKPNWGELRSPEKVTEERRGGGGFSMSTPPRCGCDLPLRGEGEFTRKVWVNATRSGGQLPFGGGRLKEV